MANNDPMQIDVVLQSTDPLNVSLGEMYKGGDGSFAGLSDVALDNPTNGQVPKYNAETEKWENADDNTVSNLTDLEDVNISNPIDGQIVRYDAETDKFIASDEQVGDSVSVTQSLTQGTKIGEISVDGQTTELFAPTPASPTEVTVTQIQSTGTKIATIGVDGIETDLFAPEGGGGASSADQVSVDDTDLAYEADDVQEALEKITKRLTYAEYKALTDAEKNNGTIYLITDVNGDGQSFQPVIYSEEEREIGVWIDGKPLYQKTLKVAPIALSNGTTIPHGVSDLDILADVFIVLHRNSGTELYLPYTTVYKNTSNFVIQGGNLVFVSTDSWQASDYINLYATLRYTKTTDVAGSGTWTPQGIPAVHYSTDEHVVGTWIDGSTMYEKTFFLSQRTSITNDYTTYIIDDTTIYDIDNIISCEVFDSNSDSDPLTKLAYLARAVDVLKSNNKLIAFYNTNNTYKMTGFTLRYTKSST